MKKTRAKKTPEPASEPAIDKLTKVAFGNVLDFARFNPDGTVEIFDRQKAREIGAKVSVVVRKIGHGQNAREVREISIRMPNKFRALMKLLDLVDPPRPKGRAPR